MIDKATIQDVFTKGAFAQGASYGFNEGFDSAVEYLRSLIDVMPLDKITGRFAAGLVEALERVSGNAHADFVANLETPAVILAVPESSAAHCACGT